MSGCHGKVRYCKRLQLQGDRWNEVFLGGVVLENEALKMVISLSGDVVWLWACHQRHLLSPVISVGREDLTYKVQTQRHRSCTDQLGVTSRSALSIIKNRQWLDL